MFYALPPLGETVTWKPGPVATFVRFTADSVALLHYSSEPFMMRTWSEELVHVGISAPLPGLPVLAAQFGEEGLSVAAPVCVFELGDAAAAEDWLNRTEASKVLLLLLEPGPVLGQAQVRAVRTAGGIILRALREQLRTQYEHYTWDDAGTVQAAGRQLLLDNEPDTFILDAKPLLRFAANT